MIVQKYGGSSLETVEKMKAVAHRIVKRYMQGEDMVIVVSAMGKTTNQLLQLAQTAVKNPSKREMDTLIATGEQVSIALLSMMLHEANVDAVSLTGFQAGIQTEGLHTKNKIKDINVDKIQKHLRERKVVVVAGFQGINEEGDITTLGRGGSDTTAVALAAKLGCRAEIYTDVSGIYGVDPRIYPKAKQHKTISYEEMSELAFLGAKVMEPRSVEIGQKYHVEIYVASAHSDALGTTIKEKDPMIEQQSITGISVSEQIVTVTIHRLKNENNSVARLFAMLAKNGVNVDMISQSLTADGFINVAFTAPKEDLTAIVSVTEIMQKTYPDITVTLDEEQAKLSVVGLGMRSQTGVASQVIELLAQHNISFSLVTTSEISISYTLNRTDIAKAVEAIASAFNL